MLICIEVLKHNWLKETSTAILGNHVTANSLMNLWDWEVNAKSADFARIWRAAMRLYRITSVHDWRTFPCCRSTDNLILLRSGNGLRSGLRQIDYCKERKTLFSQLDQQILVYKISGFPLVQKIQIQQ